MKNTSFFSIGFRDLVKGFLVAALTAFVAGLSVTIDDGSLPDLVELKQLGLMGLAAGIAYLTKNFLTNSKDEFAKKEPNKDTYKP